jgi:hypothetical protein
MLRGAHLANGPILEADLALFKLAGFKSALVFWYHTAADVQRLRDVGCEHFVVRLPDSHNPDDTIPSYWAYAAECRVVIDQFYALGVRDFQMDNEWQADWYRIGEKAGWKRENVAFTYQWFLSRALTEVRQFIPKDVRVGFPPLIDVELPSALAACRGIAPRFDFLCVHSYWQAERDMTSKQFGGNVERFHEWVPWREDESVMPVLVTEWGNSQSQSAHPPFPSILEARMARQYPQWEAWAAQHAYVEGSYVYILGGSQDWAGFRLTPKIAGAMGHRRMTQQGRI